MGLILILGPMKSGKSHELISFFAPLKYAKLKYGLFQSARNVRDAEISSRNGLLIEAEKIASLAELLESDYEIIGLDEVHMFDSGEIRILERLISKGVRIVAAGLDLDYRGNLIPAISKLLELGPDEVRYRKAVCEKCRSVDAVYTQVYFNEEPVTSGAPLVIPADGTYGYSPVCRKCFIRQTEKSAGLNAEWQSFNYYQ